MNITMIGIGQVGSALATALIKAGHTVIVAARNPESNSVKAALAKAPTLRVKSPVEAVAESSVIFLATPFPGAEEALSQVGDLTGKILVDCTNPVAVNLAHGLNNVQSGSEFIQNLVPTAHVVKAFTICGVENFENSEYPGYGDLKPLMLIAGNDAAAKQVVSGLCRALGWDPEDAGTLSSSLHLEHMTLLWIKMARIYGKGTGFVWALLQR